ncbi:hypothetical protein, partial [Neobacillus soli]
MKLTNLGKETEKHLIINQSAFKKVEEIRKREKMVQMAHNDCRPKNNGKLAYFQENFKQWTEEHYLEKIFEDNNNIRFQIEQYHL